VLVTDANGCQQSDTVMINQPDSLKFSMKIDNYIRCFGDTTGQITATAKGGKGTYTYLWNFNKNYNNKTAVNLASGWYVLRLRDNNNCLTIDSIFMPQPDDIKTKIATVTNLKCYNDKTGYAEINVTGGTTPYYVKWDNGGYTSQGFSKNNLTAGNHWAYVRDFQGCYDTLKITLYQPDSILTLYKTRRDVLCYKGNTGWAEMEIVGGTKPYQYLWENGDTTKRASNLLANSYWLRIKDKNGCLYNDTIQMAQPAELDVFVKRTDSVSCYGFSDGIAEITATGGIAPYGYWYFDGKDTIRGTTLKGAKARQLPFKYDGYVMDAHGCVDYTPVYIKEPAKLQVVRNGQVDLLCYGARTASISVGAKGGNGGYMYNWNSMPKQFTPVAKDLKAGSYILTLKDYKGCTTYDTITIKQPAKNPVLALSSIPFCLNKDVQLSAYMYELDSIWWFNPFNKLVSNAYPNYIKIKSNFLDSGYYTILARDKQGCYDTTKIKVVINNLPRVSAWIRETGRYCKSDTITLMSTGALGYNWTGPNNFSSNLQNPTLTGLRLPMNGKYIVTGTDMNSCQSKDSLTLNIQNNININADQEICAGSNLTLTGSGAEKYNWSGPHGFSSTLQSPFIVDVEDSMAGKYTLFAVDKYGCKDTLFTHTLIYPRPFINPTAIQPVCAGEPLNLSSNGGGNYQYRWEGPLNFITSSTNPRIMTTTAKESGYYNVHASYQADVNNLCKDSARVFARIFDNPIASFLLTPQSTIYLTEAEYNINDNSKGANRWSYYLNDKLWSANPYTTFTVNDAGRLFIKQVVNSADFSVYSNQYCTDSIEQVFIIEYKPKIWLPNAFTPNNNNKNELFYPIGVNITEYRLRIFDRWGNKIFDELNGKWDGMDKNGNPYPVGAYGVYLTYKDITGQEREIKDNVTLLR
jgi:gliding motility-associated-like protein